MSGNNNLWINLRRVEPVAIYPRENIIHWSVRAAIFYNGDESHHLVGFVPTRSGRVTSAIQKFSPENRTMTTRSGRVYTLLGMPGGSDDAEYVWQSWRAVNGVVRDRDVTDEYTKQIKNLVM